MYNISAMTDKHRIFIDAVYSKLDSGNCEEARELLDSSSDFFAKNGINESNIIEPQLASAYIEYGNDCNCLKTLDKGIELFEKFEANQGLSPELAYNLGNGWSARFKKEQITWSNFRPNNIANLLRAKQYFWTAFKLFDFQKSQLLVNLANTLRDCGRISEAVRFYDKVLSVDSQFHMATYHKSIALSMLNDISSSYSVQMLKIMYKSFKICSHEENLPVTLRQLSQQYVKALGVHIIELGYDPEENSEDEEQTSSEFSEHSNYRKWCLENHLSLCEHAIYCNCYGAQKDDLTIPPTTGSIGGDFVPRMELYLNRIKSEFVTARHLYYLSINEDPTNALFKDELRFTELFDGEIIGPKSEMLRLSFRMCFGVLDKIAQAICELFDLADNNEIIYFESFWKPSGRNLSANKLERWGKLNKIENISLVALYTQATDLNTAKGDFPELKKWRNALEHELLFLVDKNDTTQNLLNVISVDKGDLTVDIQEFTDYCDLLLQQTRSAIYNFVFCVRKEGEKYRSRGDEPPFEFNMKDSIF